MNCPLCIDQTLEPHHRGGIEIDICPRCKGIWLDRGELERLADAPETPLRARPAGRDRRDDERYRDDDRRDGSGRKTSKKKSLGSRLGDLLEDALDL